MYHSGGTFHTSADILFRTDYVVEFSPSMRECRCRNVSEEMRVMHPPARISLHIVLQTP